jgi:hypothetical protein
VFLPLYIALASCGTKQKTPAINTIMIHRGFYFHPALVPIEMSTTRYTFCISQTVIFAA